jgi:hypothetical protein
MEKMAQTKMRTLSRLAIQSRFYLPDEVWNARLTAAFIGVHG